MAEYDGLALNTPTKVSENPDTECWATRTANGGTVEYRVKAGSGLDRRRQLEAQAVTALANNTTYIALVSPSNAQVAAQVKALTKQVSAIIRLRQGILDALD